MRWMSMTPWEFSGCSVVRNLWFHFWGPGVQFPVRELRSHMPLGQKIKKNKMNKWMSKCQWKVKVFLLNAKSWLIGKDSDAGRDWGQEEKGTTEDEMAGWHHRLDGHEFEWTPGDSDGQGGLACCDSWGRKESDTTERLNWTDLSNVNDFFKIVEEVNNCSLLFAKEGKWWWIQCRSGILIKTGHTFPHCLYFNFKIKCDSVKRE